MDQEPDRSKALFTEAWAWREQLQRAMDGCHSTDDMSAYSLAHYKEFEGPNIPLPSGYQVPCLWPFHLHLSDPCTPFCAFLGQTILFVTLASIQRVSLTGMQ